MKKRHSLYLLLLLLIPINIKAAASMGVSCNKSSVNPKETVECIISAYDVETSGGEGKITVTNGTVKSVEKIMCAQGDAEESQFFCVHDYQNNSINLVKYTIEAGESGTTTFAVSNAKIVGKDFDTISVNVTPVNISINAYLVTLNSQNATTPGTSSVTAYFGGSIPSITVPQKAYTLTYNHNGSGAANTIANAVYTFGGYYTSTNGAGTKYINADGTSAKNYDFNEDKTLYAKWSGGSVTLPSSTRVGYTLDGWYDASTNGNKIGNSGSSYTPSANKTLYAHWNANQYIIALNNQGASTAGTASIYEKYNTGFYTDSNLSNKMTSSSNGITIPTKKYTLTLNNNNGQANSTMDATSTFGGYYTSTNGEGTQLITSSGKLASTASTTSFTSSSTLYAKWTSGSITLPTPTKTNHIFMGWYSSLENGTKIADGGTSYTPTENKTLYAIYKEILKSNTYEVKNKIVYAKPLTQDYTQAELVSKIETANTYEIYNKTNEKVTTNTQIGTGFRIKTSEVYYDVVVLGDTTGDGYIALGDVSAIYNHYRGNKLLSGLNLEAAKLTGNDEVTIGDVAKLYNFYRGNKPL